MSAAVPSWQALDSSIFPAHALRDDSGELTIAGVRATALIDEFGSPLYVIDESDARQRAHETVSVFTREFGRVGAPVRMYYAGKALLTTEVARWMAEAGLGIDVATEGELAIALAAGVEPARIGLHGNNKSDRELERAVSAGVGSIIIDSAEEIDRIAEVAARHGVRQSVMLRVNSGVHASTHEYLATSHEDQKFGVSAHDAVDLVARIRAQASLNFLGLHCHIGSQIFDVSGFTESARRMLDLTAKLRETGEVSTLNLGGGFGVAYVASDDPMPISEIARELADRVREAADELNTPVPEMAFEPGRVIIGPSGLTLYRVGTVKPVELEDGASRLYVSVDGGMSDNIRTALYGADYTARLANRVSAAPPQLARVVGKHCESGDVVVDHEQLPADIHRDDLLVVATTGAYCWSLSNNYNAVPRPPIVAVRDGNARVIVRGETEADLLSRNVDWSAS